MDAAEKAHLIAETNRRSLELTSALLAGANVIASRHGVLPAVTVVIDAALTAAVAVMTNAAMACHFERDDDLLRKRLDHILSLEDRIHERRADGTFGPGQAVN